MRLVFACVVAWFVLVAVATLVAASPATGATGSSVAPAKAAKAWKSPLKGGSLIVTK